jgi:LCP family protein required for cell wall assembly
LKTVSSTRALPATPSPHTAAILSFVWPGLGHLYTRRPRAAALFAIPVFVIALVLIVSAAQGLAHIAALMITPTSSFVIFLLVILLGLWRIVSIADSMLGLGVRSPWFRGRTARTFGILAVIVLITPLAIGYVAWAFFDASSRIFDVGTGGGGTAAGSPGPGASSGVIDELQMSPIATPDSATGRINILLLGIDSAQNRNEALTDTQMVISIDPVTGAVAMISIPRDIANFEMPDGEIYHGKINSLMTYARLHPKEFPAGPLATVISELSYLLGAPIHYYAAADLEGFSRMIDLVGGVTVDNPRAINDPRYAWLGSPDHGFFLSAGVHTLDGIHALAYVRSRQGLGDSDFTRARRQQQVLIALRDKLIKPEMITKIPAILDAAADSLSTNFPPDRIGEMIDLASRTTDAKITQVVLGPPYALHPPNETTGGTYTLKLDMARIAKFSIKIFGDESRYASP